MPITASKIMGRPYLKQLGFHGLASSWPDTLSTKACLISLISIQNRLTKVMYVLFCVSKFRVLCLEVGGAFMIKIQIYLEMLPYCFQALLLNAAPWIQNRSGISTCWIYLGQTFGIWMPWCNRPVFVVVIIRLCTPVYFPELVVTPGSLTLTHKIYSPNTTYAQCI